MSEHQHIQAVAADEALQLARRLREAREFMNLSQQFVSEQTAIPRSAISDIERGSRRVESLELKRLAELYRMPVGFFLGDASPAEEAELAGAPAADPTVRALARTAAEMGGKEREEVLRFALFLQNFERREGARE